MLVLRAWRAKIAQFSEDGFKRLASAVEADLHPLVRSARHAQVCILNIGPEIAGAAARTLYSSDSFITPIIDGEIFTDGTILFVVGVRDASRKRFINLQYIDPASIKHDEEELKLHICYVGAELEILLQPKFLAAVQAAFETTLEVHPFSSAKFNEIKDDNRLSPSPSEYEEVAAADALAAQHARTLAIAIKSSGGLLVRDLAKQLPSEARTQIDNIRESISSKGLLATEVVVVCRSSQAQIARNCSPPWQNPLDTVTAESIHGRAWTTQRSLPSLAMT